MHIVKQSTKFIKPATQTPPSFHHYKIGFLDENAPPYNLNVVLFYSSFNNDDNDNENNFVSQLEKSLEKALTRFYPLAGRYLEEKHVVECLDQGVEFIHAKVMDDDIKYEEIVGSEVNLRLVEELIPSALGAVDQVTDPLLSIQLTAFESGGVALGVSISHRVADVSTLCTFLNEWAAISRGAEFPPGSSSGFNSASFFPPRGIPPILKGLIPRTKSGADMIKSRHVTKKLSFTDEELSDLKDKLVGTQQYCSKVVLVSALLWKAFIDIDQRKQHAVGGDDHPQPRHSFLMMTANLRGKTSIPKDSCGNLSTSLYTECKSTNDEETTTREALIHRLRNAVKNFIDDYAKVRHDSEQVEKMVLNSISNPPSLPDNAFRTTITSWCKSPFYQVDFGFGKPIWVSCGRALGTNLVYLMDGVGGNGIEAYVGVQDKDVPYFDEALHDIKTFKAN